MSLRAFEVQNYRCFMRSQRVELRPLTVLLGRNNAGKSVLARWPLIASTGFLPGSGAPLALDDIGPEELRVAFRDLIYGQRPHGSVKFVLHYSFVDFPDFSIEAVIQNIDELQSQVVSEFLLRKEGRDGPIVHLAWQLEAPSNPDGPVTYAAAGLPSAVEGPLSFEGLLPTALPPEFVSEGTYEFFQEAVSRARVDIGEVRYVGPFRDRPHRHYRTPTRAPVSVGTIGADAPNVLADDRLRRSGAVLDHVNALLSETLRGWRVDVLPLGELYSLVLTPPDGDYSINIADTGTGVAQVLPILVQRAMDQSNLQGRPVLEIVEQPELHLHPSAHADLADVYLSAAATEQARFLIETHSETFLLRLRRRIAEGLDPETVALYFVDHDGQSSSARRINLDRMGNVDYWPEGIFAEDYEETRRLAEAQLRATEADASRR